MIEPVRRIPLHMAGEDPAREEVGERLPPSYPEHDEDCPMTAHDVGVAMGYQTREMVRKAERKFAALLCLAVAEDSEQIGRALGLEGEPLSSFVLSYRAASQAALPQVTVEQAERLTMELKKIEEAKLPKGCVRICLRGPSGAGKTKLADAIAQIAGPTNVVSMARPMKALLGDRRYFAKEAVSRQALQTMSDAIRTIDRDRLAAMALADAIYGERDDRGITTVIDDARFADQAEYCHERGFVCFWLPGRSKKRDEWRNHASEQILRLLFEVEVAPELSVADAAAFVLERARGVLK